MSEIEERNVPPAGEQVHMPARSALPLINAAGLAIAIISLTFSWVLVVAGLVVFLSTAVLWIRSTRREIAELPLDHDAH
jgi:hypothetical protein